MKAELATALSKSDMAIVWRKAKWLASPKLVPKANFYSRVRMGVPQVDEWVDFLALKGPLGGMEAFEIDVADVIETEDHTIAVCASDA